MDFAFLRIKGVMVSIIVRTGLMKITALARHHALRASGVARMELASKIDRNATDSRIVPTIRTNCRAKPAKSTSSPAETDRASICRNVAMGLLIVHREKMKFRVLTVIMANINAPTVNVLAWTNSAIKHRIVSMGAMKKIAQMRHRPADQTS